MHSGRQLWGVLLGAAALAAVVTWGAPRNQPGVLMADGDLDAMSIDMDQNAMLAADPKKNAAFMRVFGSYMNRQQGDSLMSAPAGTTQLAQQQHARNKGNSADINAKLAEEMQAKLTAGSQDDEMMTPHFVAALNAASGNQMLASSDGEDTDMNEKALAALSMTDKHASAAHVLPPKLREKYMLHKDKAELKTHVVETPDEAALLANPVQPNTQSLSSLPAQGRNNAAAKADDALLASAPDGVSTKDLIKEAALRQMQTLSSAAPAPAPVQQLQQQPAFQAPSAMPQAAPAFTQQMYQRGPYQTSMYPAAVPQQYAYAQPPMYAQPQPMLSSYGATQYPQQPASWYPPAAQPASYVNEAPQRLEGYAPPQRQAVYSPPQFMQPAPQQQLAYQPSPMSTASSYQYAPQPQQMLQQASQTATSFGEDGSQQHSAPVMSARAIGEAAANGAAPNWRTPDATIKGKGGLASKREQMEALRTQILSDYKTNTRDAEKALLMGP